MTGEKYGHGMLYVNFPLGIPLVRRMRRIVLNVAFPEISYFLNYLQLYFINGTISE
jgi:hypothetical protein